MENEKEFVGQLLPSGEYIEYSFICKKDSPFYHENSKGKLVRRVNVGMRMLAVMKEDEYKMSVLVEWYPTGERFWIPQDYIELVEVQQED